MDKRTERTALLAGLLAAVWLIVNFALSRVTQLRVLAALLPFLAIALVISLVVYIRERLIRRAAEEKQAAASAARERVSGSIFDEAAGAEPYSFRSTQTALERFVVPVIALLLAGGIGYWILVLYRELTGPAGQRLLALAFLGGQAFTTFLLSRYLLGYSRQARLLRGPGIALGVTCFASVLAGIATLVSELAYPRADAIAAKLLLAVLGVLAVELVVNFIANLYRPRRKGDELCRSYESRLGGLITEPGSWARNVAGSLDYQFGFKVSDSWLYRFLEDALLPLIIFQLIALYLLSCLVFLAPDEKAILEHFGKPVAELDSGFHLKMPWPFATIRRFPVKRILSLRIGQTQAGGQEPPVIQWNVPHAQGEEQFLVAAPRLGEGAVPVNLVAFNVPVEYQITNIYAFAYHYADSARLLDQIAHRILTQEAATRDLFDLMGEGQTRVANSLWQRIQAEADHRQLGIQIVFVGLQGVHPPTQVAEAFQSVIGALELKEASILLARATAGKTVTLAEADGAKATYDAQAYRAQRTEISAAEADRFLTQVETQKKSPHVFRANLYLTALANSLEGARKFIVPAGLGSEVLQLNFEDKLRPELFDLGPQPAKKKE
ncbi:MAG: protease modulator HflK [Verrucomicrobiota bacterium]